MPLIEALAEALAPGVPIESYASEDAITREDVCLAASLKGGADSQRLWTNHRCLVTTRRFARMDCFAAAAEASKASGWPVHVRASGGTTVVHRPGILNYSTFHAVAPGAFDVGRSYRTFCDHIVAAAAKFGVRASVGAVAGSYCDGRFNIIAGDRKIAGTASLVRSTAGRVAIMMHASICVEGDVDADIDAITDFESMLGLSPNYAPNAHVAFASLLEVPA